MRRGAAVGYGTVEGATELRPVFVQHDRSRMGHGWPWWLGCDPGWDPGQLRIFFGGKMASLYGECQEWPPRELVMAASEGEPVLMGEYAGRYNLGNDTICKGITSSNDTKSLGRTKTRSVKESLTSLQGCEHLPNM